MSSVASGPEQVLKSLINFKGHSWPFLKPVTKKSAPDYELVVSKPMSLMVISDKVRPTRTRTEAGRGVFVGITHGPRAFHVPPRPAHGPGLQEQARVCG